MSIRMIAASIAVALSTFAAIPAAQAESDCRYTQGYWQNRAQNTSDTTYAAWIFLSQQPFYQSGKTYAEVLVVAPRGNAYWILAHQLVAAEANLLNGADSSGAPADAIAMAQELMRTYTPAQIAAIPKNSELRADFVELAAILDDWNNGLIGTGICGGGGT